MANANRDPILAAAADHVLRNWGLAEEGYGPDHLRVTYSASVDQVLVDLIHCGTARFFVVDFRDRLDAAGYLVGVDLVSRQVAVPRA